MVKQAGCRQKASNLSKIENKTPFKTNRMISGFLVPYPTENQFSTLCNSKVEKLKNM